VPRNRVRATVVTAIPVSAARSKKVGLGWYAVGTGSVSHVRAFKIAPVSGTREV
jgi:hypothetical protein